MNFLWLDMDVLKKKKKKRVWCSLAMGEWSQTSHLVLYLEVGHGFGLQEAPIVNYIVSKVNQVVDRSMICEQILPSSVVTKSTNLKKF
jgi:hypothetical protein